MQWSRNMVHSHLTLCLRFHDYLKRLSQHPWYGLWMRVKGPHQLQGHGSWLVCEVRATSYTWLRAHAHYDSSTLVGGEGGAGGPSSLFHTTLRDQLQGMWIRDGCKFYVDFYMASTGSCCMVTWTIFTKPPLGGRPNTTTGDHGPLNAHNRWSILYYHVRGPALIEIRWNSIWLRVQSHMASHYTWGSVTTLRDFGGVSGRHLVTFFWAHTISWLRLLARVWSGP